MNLPSVPDLLHHEMCAGGLIVGALAIFYPQVCGNGYNVVNEILRGEFIWQTLALILIFKVLATTATFGSAAVGGVFTPYTFRRGEPWIYLRHRHPARHRLRNCEPQPLRTCGMGAFLAAATHAPILAIVMIFELTLDYQIILPLMLACVVGYYTSIKIERRSIYAEALKRKGAGDYATQLAELHVRDLMKPNPLTISPTTGFSEIGEKFINSRFNYLYVTDHADLSGRSHCTTSRAISTHPSWRRW